MRWGCLFSRSIWRDCGAGSACRAAAGAEPHASPRSAPRRGAEGRVGRPDSAFRLPPSQLGIPRPVRVPRIARPARVTYIRRPARRSGTRAPAPAAGIRGRGGGRRRASGGVTGESSAEAAAHPNAGGGGSVRPGKNCPSKTRRTVSTRSACVILAARAAGPACAAASAFACSRSMRSLSALSMRWSASARRARSSVATGSARWPSSAIVTERQRSQGLDCDERATAFGAGLPRAHPFLGKAVGLALQADQAVHALGPATLGGSRTRAASCARDQRRTLTAPRTDARHDLVHGSAVLDRCSHGVLDCGRLRLVR